jgi:hypothetical protein
MHHREINPATPSAHAGSGRRSRLERLLLLAWCDALMGSAGQHAVTLERSNPLIGVAEIFSQHLSIVFPEKRCVELELVGKSREPQRKSRDLKLAENPIMNGSHRSAFEKWG